MSCHLQMVAKGKDCSDLFPAVVKNVVSKNSEVSHCWEYEKGVREWFWNPPIFDW